MANYAMLKSAIADAIKTNGTNAITGALLQQQLLAMVNSLGAGYQYAGIATPSTNPGTPDQNVFYFASTAGTYTNFDALVLADGEVAILKYNGAWSKDSTGAASLELAQSINRSYRPGFMSCDNQYKGRLIEAYFTGLNNTHTYDFQYFRYYENGTYKVVQVWLRDKTTNTAVAIVEHPTAQDYFGVLELKEYNSSGITGYVLVDVKTTDTQSFINSLNVKMASTLEYSPFIYEYLHPHVLQSEYDENFLRDTIFVSVSNRALLGRVRQIHLYNIDPNETYRISTCNYYVSDSYKAYIVHIKNSADTTVCVWELQSLNDFCGVVKFNPANNSGIYAYAYIDMKTTDTNGMTGVFNNANVFAYEQFYVPAVAESLPFVNAEMLGNYGNPAHDGISAFSGVTAKTIATFDNANFAQDGILKSITVYPFGSTVSFGIGIIDQRGIAVIRKEFTLNCTPNVVQTLDVALLGISVYVGETLFVTFSDSEHCIGFISNGASHANLQMVYGLDGGVLVRLATTYGGRLNLYWEYEKINSPFAYKGDVEAAEQSAQEAKTMANEALSNFALVKDRQGNYYQLVVVNGQLSIIPLTYKKVLIICNSIGVNGRVYAQGWCANRGMAASKNGLDYKTHVENGLKQKDATAQVVLRNVWNWEQDFDSITPADLMDGYLAADTDCIIFRAGENVPLNRISGFQENLTDLLNYCQSQCPNANMFITSMVWSNADKDTALQNTAFAMGVPFVDVAAATAEYKERIGDYLFGDYTPDAGQTWDTSTQVLYKVTGSGVAGHTNDVGMLLIANNILTALKYEPLELLHNINIGSIGAFTCSLITNKWVAGGVVNVFSNGNTVTVTDSDNNNVPVTNHNDGVFSFEMPNKDVTISIS